MTTPNHDETLHSQGAPSSYIEVADTTLSFRRIALADNTPTGAQIARLAGLGDATTAVVLQWQTSGGIEDIRPEEVAQLSAGLRFIVASADRTYRFQLNGVRYEWPSSSISVEAVRQLGQVPPVHSVYLERQESADLELRAGTAVALSAGGVERIYSKRAVWALKVQGVGLEFDTPSVRVRDAMERAGFDPAKAWHIFFIVQGQPKQELTVDSVMDLGQPGVEKLRLVQRNVDNGLAGEPQRAFAVLPADVKHLDAVGLVWETVISEEGRRWLLVHDYPLPSGALPATATLALEIPASYPQAQIDMFYFLPFVHPAAGGEYPSTQIRATIRGQVYQGWSRHRNAAAAWNPQWDNIATHLALVETALLAETEK